MDELGARGTMFRRASGGRPRRVPRATPMIRQTRPLRSLVEGFIRQEHVGLAGDDDEEEIIAPAARGWVARRPRSALQGIFVQDPILLGGNLSYHQSTYLHSGMVHFLDSFYLYTCF